MENTYQLWLDASESDPQLKEQLAQLSQVDREDAFASELEFGTAGLRGILGAGTNRMNRYIIRQTTEGLAQWIEHQGLAAKERGVAISYDNRHCSEEFAKEAALVLGHHGIKTYLFDRLHPTPILSFAVRYYHCIAGIMVTASHNPPNYNGFKVYGSDGGQFPPAAADELTEIIRRIPSPFEIEIAEEGEMLTSGNLVMVGPEVVAAYLEELKSVTVDPSISQQVGDQLKIVFSPMHGTASVIADQVFEQAGFTQVIPVVEQTVVDSDFSTVESPNPEVESAFELAKQYGHQHSADLLLATDPDADRLGVMVRQADGDYYLLSGNQTASLMFHYIVSRQQALGNLPDNPALVRSIVSTPFVDQIAQDYGVDVFEVLTGFKFIADKIKEFEITESHHYVMGFEEAIGYLIRPFVRDKDSIQALVLLCEIAGYYKLQGKSLLDALDALYQQYGYYQEKTISVQYPGLTGKERMAEIMTEVRQTKFDQIGGIPVVWTADYSTQIKTHVDGQVESLPQSKSNVLRYQLEDGSWVALRPSGTEPKIKLYMGSVAASYEAGLDKLAAIEQDMRQRIE